jgi:glucosamine--fructose-6-phosphate aminotransferase (isomerizing)
MWEDGLITNFSRIDGEYLRDLLNQPQALEDTLRGLDESRELRDLAKRLNKGKFQKIVLTGMGSSFHALHPLNLELVAEGFTPVMVETSELVHYQNRLLDDKTLVVAVSQSGHSVEMVRLIEANRRRAALIAVTNTSNSPLANSADATVLTQAGREFSVSCKTYVAALMALKWLGNVLMQCDLRRTHLQLMQVAPAVSEYLLSWQQHVTDLGKGLAGIGHLFLVGRGPSLATVGTGALIVKESDHFHAEGMSSAAFRHGPLEMLGPGMFVLVFAGEEKTRDLNIRLLQDILEQDDRAELVGELASTAAFQVPHLSPSLTPILEILPVQMVTLALAAQAGREPGRFELATKITTIE